MAISNSDIPQPLWERAVALVQKQGMPVNASTIQSAMNTLAEGGSGSAEPNVGMDNQIDSLMARNDSPGSISQTSSGNAPVTPVTSAPLQTTLPTQKPTRSLADMNLQPGAGMDEIAFGNLNAERGQGPASLNSHDAEAPDARDPDKIAYAGNTQNAAPGTQGMNDMGLEDASAIGSGGDAAMAGGGLAALIATLTKRNKPSLGQSIHLGDAMAKPAINQYEGSMSAATDDELRRYRQEFKDGRFGRPMEDAPKTRTTRSGRGGGAKMRGRSSKPYDPDITLM